MDQKEKYNIVFEENKLIMICFCRIDEKLIHGQVATTWVRIAGANRICIVDDVTANDQFMTSVYKNTAPQGTIVDVWNIEDAKQKLKIIEKHDSVKAMVLAKSPIVFLDLLNSGIKIESLNIGNMSKQGSRIQLTPSDNTYADEAEIEAFRQLVSSGVDVYLQMIPDRRKIPIMDTPGINQTKKNE